MTSAKVWPLLLLPFSLFSMAKAGCPFPIVNGNVVLSSESILKNSFPNNSQAFVECAKGQERDTGPTSITCVNGVWSQVKLICKKKDCGQPAPSPNLIYSIPYGTLFGAQIKPICAKGYDLEGSSSRQCLDSGWSGKVECILTECDLPKPIENGKMDTPRDQPVFDDVITFSCDDNYILIGNSSITCGQYGEYNLPPPKCIAGCPFPVVNGNVVLSSESILKNSFPNNSQAIVECAKGHERDTGPTSITCVNGVWSQVKLICKKKDCGQPAPSPNLIYSIHNGTLFGARIKPICAKGYDLEGSSYRHCLDSGWSGKVECILTECDLPKPIENGKMDAPRDQPVFDDVITFSCDDNYILIGNSSITCGQYGEYNLPPPKCIASVCSVPEVKFGNLIEGNPPYTHKSIATFECWPDYRMKGSATSVCENSVWSALPVCEKVIITSTKASTTTKKVTTKSTPTALTRKHGGLINEGKIARVLTTVLLVLAAAAAAAVVSFFLYMNLKRKGSYNTGEELRAKEELLLNQSV